MKNKIKWVKDYLTGYLTYSLRNADGIILAEIDRIYGNEDGYRYRTVIRKNNDEYYDYFSKLKNAKSYLINEVLSEFII